MANFIFIIFHCGTHRSIFFITVHAMKIYKHITTKRSEEKLRDEIQYEEVNILQYHTKICLFTPLTCFDFLLLSVAPVLRCYDLACLNISILCILVYRIYEWNRFSAVSEVKHGMAWQARQGKAKD